MQQSESLPRYTDPVVARFVNAGHTLASAQRLVELRNRRPRYELIHDPLTAPLSDLRTPSCTVLDYETTELMKDAAGCVMYYTPSSGAWLVGHLNNETV